jgi:hypothetical protein
MRRDVLRMAVITLLLLGLAVPLAAQGALTGSVRGTVKDPDGGVLPGVTVTALSNVLVAGKLTATTDDRGAYRFPSLPPGTYDIEAELSGFRTTRQEGIRISLGQTLAVDLVLSMAAMAEEITVTAEAPVVSVVSNSVATSFGSEFLDKQPLPRDYYALLAAAPGVTLDVGTTSSMMAYGGTSQGQNAYTLDGVNVADTANGTYWLLPSIQWMQEIQISGLGAAAEYGGFTGGIINGVTKSGGNEFHGGVEYYYQPKSWTDSNDPSGEATPYSFTDGALSLGGPVVKDKLWYFVSGEYWQQETTPIGAAASDKRTTPRVLGKLTWQANEGNRLMFMAEQDKLTHDNRGVDIDTLPEASANEESPNNTFALNWESLINASNFINVKLTGYVGELNYLPYHGNDTSGRDDYWNTDIDWQNQKVRTLRDKQQIAFDASWSLFVNGLLSEKADHSFKFGLSYEDGEATYLEYRNGGVTYYDDSSGCPGETAQEQFDYYRQHPECGLVDEYSSAYYDGIYQEWLQTSTFSLYAQDSLRLDRWTINFGARYGQYSGGFQQGHGDSDVYDVSFVDPRVGFVWDMFGTGRSALKAHYGRYHEKMMGYIYDREASGQIDIPYTECYWDTETGGYNHDYYGDPGCDHGVPEYAAMGDYGHQYVDEILLTFEQQLGQDMMVGVDLIDRKFRDIMAMINVNDDYTERLVPGNPLTGDTLPVYVLNSPQEYVLTTDNGAYRDYQAAILRFEKRYSNGWQLWSSFVWTDLKGNQYSSYGYIDEFKDKNGFTNADGQIDLSYNKYDFKLNAAVDLPLNLQLSGQYNYLSGMYWTPWVRVRRGLDYNSSTGRDINLLPRGSNQFPDRNLINLRLAWNPKLGGKLRMTVSAEVFNVTNSSTTLGVDGQWGTLDARPGRNTWVEYDTYGQVEAIEAPRQYRAGIRFEF